MIELFKSVGHIYLTAILLLIWQGSDLHGQTEGISYDRDIRPILSDKCFACHGPDPESRGSDLRLDREEDAHDYAIVPGEADDSDMFLRIISDDPDYMMPKANSHKKKLTDAEVELIKKWIDQGAKYENFWAFEKPVARKLPKLESDNWSSNEIDRYVLNSMVESNLKPAPQADSRTLVRRAFLDLTGLPPTIEQATDFLAAEKTLGHEKAWENLVDDLMKSPHYGENMARHWLDLVRFADTNGMHKDFYRNHFAYRDWVIKAFNENLSYDKFATYQLAGDLLENPTSEQLTATAFNRLHLIIDRGTALPEESLHKNVLDRVTAASTAFLGLTAQCAQCHDHKYDPISQKEFYSLYAFFNNAASSPETSYMPPNGLQAPFISLADQDQKDKLDKFDRQLKSLEKKISQRKATLEKLENDGKKKKSSSAATPSDLRQVTTKLDDKRLEKLRKEITNFDNRLRKLKNERQAFDREVPYSMVMKEREPMRKTFVLEGGQYDVPMDEVKPGTPAFLPPLKKSGKIANRLDLAKWFFSPEQPLTSRIAVNRFWQSFFGVGIVKTSEDFGSQGGVPSHPELLDYMSVNFMESGWDIKKLVKEIVMSKTYRQSSVASEEQFKADPENRMLARGSRFRMDAELIRDQILFTSGLLSTKMYGPSVKPPQPDGLWKAVSMTGERFAPDAGESQVRRSVYTYWKRAMPPPQMTILNAPMRDACVARREKTNTPSQALLLLNEPEYMKAARSLATDTFKIPTDERTDLVWQKITGQVPDADEKRRVNSLVDELTAMYQRNPALSEELCQGLDVKNSEQRHQLAAWTVAINAIYNLDITKNRN